MYDMDFTLPEGAKPWPGSLKEPVPLQSGTPVGDLDDGYYYSRWPHGRVRLLALVQGGRLLVWMRIEEHEKAGYFATEGSPWCAQHYYGDGRMEDFSPWDDSSKPYPADMSFEQWLTENLELMKPRPPGPEAEEMKRQYEEYTSRDQSRALPPRAGHILSEEGEPPADLEKVLQGFESCSYTTLGQLHERLVNYYHWEPGRARDFTNFVPQACAWAFRAPEYRQEPDTLLSPSWEKPSTHGEAPLESVPLYAQVRALALTLREKAWKDLKHWVHSLADVHPDFHRVGDGHEKLSWALVWTLPPGELCSFWMTMHAVELLLRQEASRRGVLWQYLQGVDGERFFHAASLAGAFLQASYCTSSWYFDPGALPWRGNLLLTRYNEDLADLIGTLDDDPVGKRFHQAHPGDTPGTEGHGAHHDAPQWMKAPLLVSLGEWVHGKCAGGPPAEGDERVVRLLGRYINDHGELLYERLTSFRHGELSYDFNFPPLWPGRGMTDMGGWTGYWKGRRSEFRQSGRLFLDNRSTAEIFPELKTNAFLHRVEVAATTLMGGEPDSSALWRGQEEDLGSFLASHGELSPEHITLLRDHIIGVPFTPGIGFVRLIAATHWVFSAFVPDAWEKPGNFLFPALRLVQWLLPVF
jgi:hypothetical protein